MSRGTQQTTNKVNAPERARQCRGIVPRCASEGGTLPLHVARLVEVEALLDDVELHQAPREKHVAVSKQHHEFSLKGKSQIHHDQLRL